MPQSTALPRPAPANHRPFLWLARALFLRRSRHHLAALEPHLLRDIGLTPDQARAEAARPPWDAPRGWVRQE